MFSFKRTTRAMTTLVSAGVLAAGGLIATAPSSDAVTGHPPGVVGSLTLATNQVFPVVGHPYDVAASAGGTSYIGWISSTLADSVRKVHLCKLTVGATSCSGGIQTIASLGIGSANDLYVLLTGDDVVHLVWYHDSLVDPSHGAIAEATALHGLNLGAAHDVVANATGLRQLLDAQVDPNGGTIWTVGYAGLPAHSVQVRSGLAAAPTSVPTPYNVGYGQLAFTGYLGGSPVLAVEEYGSITAAVQYARRSSGVWGSFHPVAHTWAVGTNAALKATRHGLRLVTGVDNATYRPAISKWTGTGFTLRQLTADSNACNPSTHDGWADLSTRLLDVSWECDKVTVTNYADAFHAAIVRFGVSNTPTYAPQIASGIRGIASVAYSVQASTPNANTLRVAHVRLPDSTRTVAKTGTGGRVTVTGPRSCLPPVNVHIGWTHRPATNWVFKSGALRLAGNVVSGSTLDGATLSSGGQYTLVGTAVFGRGSDRSTVKASLTFTVC
jgi:hypothetical protein